MRKFYKSLLKTAEQVGLKIISDDYCCQLLAWLYAYGGEREMVIYNLKLRYDIEVAQSRMNLYGGEMPNIELFPVLQKYIRDVDGYLNNNENYQHPNWALAIFSKYGLTPPKSKL